jgi:hypothetical protein
MNIFYAGLRGARVLNRIALLAFLYVASVATAQNPVQNPNPSNIFVGYSFLGANLFTGQHADLNGWDISAEKKYLPFFGVVGDVSGVYGSKDLPGSGTCSAVSAGCLVHSSVNVYTFDLGIRGSYAAKRIRPFGEALFGEIHTTEYGTGLSNTNNGFNATLGAGLDCRVTRLLGCRLDVDYIVSGNFGVRHNSVRATSGLVFRF